MNQVEYEALNVVLPLQNSTGMRSQAAVLITQAEQSINLSDYFGRIGSGHYFTFQADGAKIYVSFAAHDKQAINEQTAGNGPGVCYPIADGQSLPGRFLGGREVGTSYATAVQVASGVVMRAKLALSGVATGWLRIYRSSVGPGQDRSEFRPQGF